MLSEKPMNPKLESFSYDDEIVKKFLLATLVWGAVALLLGRELTKGLLWINPYGARNLRDRTGLVSR